MSYGKIVSSVLSKAGSKAKGLGSKAKALGKRAINSQSSSARFDRLVKRNPNISRYENMSPTRFIAEDIAHQGIDTVKKHPYLSTGAGLITGDLALSGMYGDEDMSTDDIVAILQAQGFSDEEIGQYLQMHMEE